MGLRCSLFGHAFDEAVTERDRETRGAEVVVTVREVRTCSRCGAEQVIAENTEVRHLGAEDTDGQEQTSVEDSATEQPASGADGEPAQQADLDGEIQDDTASGDASTQPSGGDAEASTEDITQFVDAAEPEQGDTPEGPDTVEAGSTGDAEGTAEPEGEEESEWDGPPDSALESEDAEFIGGADEAEPSAEAGETERVEEPDEPRDESRGNVPEASEPSPDTEGTAEPSPNQDSSASQPEGVNETDGDQEPPDESSPSGGPDAGKDTDEEDDAIIMDNAAGEEDRQSDVGRRELAGSGNMFDTSAPEGGDGDSPGDGSDFSERGETTGSESPPEDTPVGSGRDSVAGGEASDDRWPGEEQADDTGDDSSFQFGPDMHPDPEETEEETTPPSGFTTGGTVDVVGPTDEDPPEAVICPECGYEARGVGSSLRAGDICPECRGAYLAERR